MVRQKGDPTTPRKSVLRLSSAQKFVIVGDPENPEFDTQNRGVGDYRTPIFDVEDVLGESSKHPALVRNT